MDSKISVIRRCSGSHVRIETLYGNYWLSPDETNSLLFFGNEIPLRTDGGVIDGEALAYLHTSGEKRRVIIRTPHFSFSVIDTALISVVKGQWATAPLKEYSRAAP